MFVRSQAKSKNVAGTPGELCRKVAKAAIESAKQCAKELGEAALDEESMEGLQKLANAKDNKPVELLKGGSVGGVGGGAHLERVCEAVWRPCSCQHLAGRCKWKDEEKSIVTYGKAGERDTRVEHAAVELHSTL